LPRCSIRLGHGNLTGDKDSARSLASDHATIARDTPLDRVPRRRDPGVVNSRLDPVRKTHGDIRTALIAEIRRRAYSIRTEQAYEQWVCRFIAFSGHRDPRQLDAPEVTAFLEHLAVQDNVAASTQNQALNALVFLYGQVLDQPLEALGAFVQAKRPRRLPVVLTRTDVRALLDRLDGTQWLMASLLYGAGMRLMECVRLRVQEVDFDYRQIVLRNAKGAKDRVVPLPESLIAPLRNHLAKVRQLFEEESAVDSEKCIWPTRWRKSTPTPQRNGSGSMCFPVGACRSTPAVARPDGITFMKTGCRKR
jgi:Site-specific recombinase XerD